VRQVQIPAGAGPPPPTNRVTWCSGWTPQADLEWIRCRGRGGLHVDFGEHPARQVLGEDKLHINARGHAVVAAEVIRQLSRRTTSLVAEA
jgi:hypothetical protein